MTFTVGSLFDGSGGFPLAAFMCGGVPVWASEVEPYPIAVTKSRFQYMKHLGDISKINGAEIEPVDVITFGSPCQDLSVAGKRAGLKHEVNGDEETTRSGLFMEAVRIIKEMRDATNGKYPRIALWENVPGAFSSNKGEDFRVVLEELIKIVEPSALMPAVPKSGWAYADSFSGDGWSLAYRVLDAQYWGVPQRRRRIYLVLDLGGRCAGEILFKREGLRGHFEKGRTPWQGTAADAEGCSGVHDSEGNGFISDQPITFEPGIAAREGGHIYESVSGTLRANMGDNQMAVVYESHPADSRIKELGEIAPTVTVKFAKGSADTPLVCMATQQGGAEIRTDDKAPTLTAAAGMSGNNQPVVCYHDQNLILDDQGGQQISVRTDGKAPTLRAEMHGNVPCVLNVIAFAQNQRDEVRDLGDKAGSLQAQPGMKQQTFIAAGFCTEHSAKSRGVGYEEEVSPTLRAGVTPAVCVKTYDARGNGDGEIVNTITGDHENRITDYTSVVVEPIYCLQGNGIDRADTAGCNGKGWKEDVCYTLNTIDRPAVVMTLQGDPVAGTLKARDYKGVGRQDSLGSAICLAYGLDRASFNQGKNAQYDFSVLPEQQPTMTARGPGAVCTKYIVRRLTPTECARLQGFADRWGDIEEKDSFTEEEYQFWLDVRNTHAAICERETIASKTKILLLANHGVNVTSNDAAELVRYLSDIERLNQLTIPSYKSISRLGWVGNKFVPYDSSIRFDGEEENRALFQAVAKSGDYDEWVKFMGPLRKNLHLRLMMAAAFASPIIEKVNALPFVFHLWGKTGKGKTVALMVAMSIWGDPRGGKLTRTMNMTNAAMMSTAAFLNNLPFAGDELQTIKESHTSYDKLIMQITEGIERGRMQYSKNLAVRNWNCAFLFTGEEPCTNSRSGGGTKNRVFEVNFTDTIIENGAEVVRFISKHHGHAGKKFIEYIADKNLSGDYDRLVSEIMDTCDTTDKQAAVAALILLADRLAGDCIFTEEDYLSVHDIAEFAKRDSEVSTSKRAYDYIIGWIARNSDKFTGNGMYKETWGVVQGQSAFVIDTILNDALEEENFSFDAVKNDWAENGYIGKYRNKFKKRKGINGTLPYCVEILLPESDSVE